MSEAESGQFGPGHFGPFGGRFVAETLIPALDELDAAWRAAQADAAFMHELGTLFTEYVGRPSLLTLADQLSRAVVAGGSDKGLRIYLKREDLNHTGAHKINNCVGQALLARKMGKRRLIAETGAGQHGVATATVAAKFGFDCDVYMGAEDVERQKLNVFRMRLLGAKVHPVSSGTRTLKDAMNEALRDWVTNVADTHYIIGSVAGPHPYPTMVRDLQAVIGREARAQLLEREGRLPDAAVACVGGGSNAMGLFHAFVGDAGVQLHGVEAAGEGIATGRHAATLSEGRVGVLHGSKSFVLTDDDGQILPAHSISAGLDYPGVGPEHAWLKQTGRATYASITDEEALAGLQMLARTEGILCALETAHAIAYLPRLAPKLPDGAVVVVALSGRGDKDMPTVARALGVDSVNRLVARMQALVAAKKKALVPYLTAGDPSLAETPALLAELARGGADVIELGVPWSDPSADGAVIQGAMERALSTGGAAHDTIGKTLAAVREFRKESDVPIVLFGYYNPLLQRGLTRVAGEARDAGVDGMLVVDLPPEESRELDEALAAAGIARVPLLAPTTSPERARAIVARASGFAYYVALTGVTGARHLDIADVGRRAAALRPALGSLPLAVGFGVRDPASARALGPHCDAVVVGSALVQAIAEAPDAAARRKVAYERVRALKEALT